MSKDLRSFGWVDARRSVVILVVVAAVGACYWFVLPFFQSLFLPEIPDGSDSFWVVRPIVAFRFGAMATMTIVTCSFVLRPFQRAWARNDAEMGSRFDFYHRRPQKRRALIAKGFLGFALYASGFVFYLSSWTVIDFEGIRERTPWGMHNHSFPEIASLETVPDGERSESLVKNGPWYSVNLKSGRRIRVSLDNEGTNRHELQSMANFIAERSGLVWVRRRDSRAR